MTILEREHLTEGVHEIVKQSLGFGNAAAMDDDDDDDDELGNNVAASTNTESGTGTKGVYVTPSKGIIFFWTRSGSQYTGFKIRDLSANNDLCEFAFEQGVVAASGTRGRRSNTQLPAEDLVLLKEELSNPNFFLQLIRGSIVADSCIPTPCTMKDVEQILRMPSPWQSLQKHRILQPPNNLKASGSSHSLDCPTKSQSMPSSSSSIVPNQFRNMDGPQGDLVAVPTRPVAKQQSEIDLVLGHIRTVLVQLNAKDALNHLTSLCSWLQVVKGTRGKSRVGGWEYMPSYMLDGVLLSDRIKTLDEMGDAMRELLAWKTCYVSFFGVEVGKFSFPRICSSSNITTSKLIHKLPLPVSQCLPTDALPGTQLRSLSMTLQPELCTHILLQVSWHSDFRTHGIGANVT